MERVSSTPRVLGKGTTDDGLAYVAMERLRGEDLAALLRKQRVPPREGAALVEKIARALDEAHALGIVHRDLKPQNVFLETSGGVRLLDFGVARARRHADADPSLGQAPGRRDRASPHLIRLRHRRRHRGSASFRGPANGTALAMGSRMTTLVGSFPRVLS
jgi:serine/threonine protein kinase